jgi:DNA-binding transcriptional regulator YiaG
MTAKTRFKSDGLKAIHSAALGLHRAGTIDKATMRGFDQTCLVAPATSRRTAPRCCTVRAAWSKGWRCLAHSP